MQKRGVRRRNELWQINIKDIPKPLGDDLDTLWHEHIERLEAQGQKPLTWHRFLISIWQYYVTTIKGEKKNWYWWEK